ncbi:sensor histidine kinase [Metabacillus herbersteinensis]|uniref:histidine kinase n=1 Tax=Metabacillus herbersteinensis TaxID=283816 RepID=A0ABV6GB00_9BACI
MKNRSLAFQIWLVFSGILLAISILLVILFPTTLRTFFTQEIYKSIENEQIILTEYGYPQNQDQFSDEINSGRDRSVHHLILPESQPFIFYSKRSPLPVEFLQHAQQLASIQENSSERYSKTIKDQSLFFVIRKLTINSEPGFLLSYAWDSYRNDLVFTLFKQLIVIMLIVFVLSWIPAIWLARYLSRPLVTLEKHVKNISELDWHKPVNVDRQDEIGKLANTIEIMRQQLVRKDEAQQTLLQNISHDLKTPVMVIRGYAKSVNDGIYPKGDLTKTMNVIEEEAERLEKKIKDLLYLTKLDFLSKRNPLKTTFRLDVLIQKEVERLRWSQPDLQVTQSLEETTTLGDEEQWGKLVENILENALRYANEKITLSLKKVESEVIVRIWNDGPAIDESIIETIFETFQKGTNGEFGIGLSIVKRIALLHQAEVWAKNEENGVSFYLKIPMENQAIK